MKRKLVLALLSLMLLGSVVGCGVKDSGKKPSTQQSVQEEEEKWQDTFAAGKYVTKDFELDITQSGMVEKDRLYVEYTLKNNSGKKMRPDEIWGFTLKVRQGEQPVVIGKFSNQDNTLAVEEKINTLHKDIKKGESIVGGIIFEVPTELVDIPVTLTALNTEDNKAIDTFELSMELMELDKSNVGVAKKASEDKSTEKKDESKAPEVEETGADEALSKTTQAEQEKTAEVTENQQ